MGHVPNASSSDLAILGHVPKSEIRNEKLEIEGTFQSCFSCLRN